LLEKVIDTPTKFRAVSIRDAVFILEERRNRKTVELQKNAKKLIRLFENDIPNGNTQNDVGQFRLIPKREALILRKKAATIHAQESIDTIINWSAFQRELDLSAEELKQALERNVKVRCMADKPADVEWPETTQALMKHGDFMLRTIPGTLITRLSIYDRREVIVSAYLTPEIAGSSALMSTNPALTGIMQSYFDDLWNNAKDATHRPQLSQHSNSIVIH
jgi:sugar-specific transcriptional regulator TrmB